jgi:MFS family permease
VQALLIVAAHVPLAKRPIYNGIFGAMYAIASVVGPLLGGAFTDKVTWRLCFYINLPCGLITAIYLVFFLPPFESEGQMLSLPLKSKLKELDLYGFLLFLPFLVCLLLALQWGGTTYAWGNARIIVLFIISGLCGIAFIAVEIRQGDRATIPPSIMARRSLWACTLFVFFLGGSFMVITFYIPIWFQAIKGTTAIQNGIDNLPSILASVVFSLVAGGLVTVVGYYTWACILSAVLTTVVCLYRASRPSNKWHLLTFTGCWSHYNLQS